MRIVQSVSYMINKPFRLTFKNDLKFIIHLRYARKKNHLNIKRTPGRILEQAFLMLLNKVLKHTKHSSMHIGNDNRIEL